MHQPIFLGGSGALAAEVAAFWLLFATWVVSELYIGRRYRIPTEMANRDRGSQAVLIASVWLGVGLGFESAQLLPGAAITVGRNALFISGLILMALGLALRWYAIAILGRSFTVAVGTRREQEVVTHGPYRFVRHPSYSGSLLTIAGIFLSCSNALAWLAFLLPVAGYAYRIQVEERALAADLGEPYRAYMRRTRRLIPFVL